MVSEESAEASCREVAGFSAEFAHKHMMRLARRQRELLTFVMTMTEDLTEAQEIATYAFVVICRMFELGSGGRLPKAKAAKIAAAYERSHEELGRLLAADERFLERYALVSSGS